MTRIVALLLVLLGACAERNEVIATVDGSGGAAGQGGGPPEVLLVPSGTVPLACGAGTDVVLDDADGDGHTDALVAAGCLGLYQGAGDGTLAGGEAAPVFGTSMAVGRIDGDATLDVLGFDDQLRVFLGDGTGVFHHVGDVNAIGPGALGDVGAGAELDVVTASGHELSLWAGDGAGNFTGPHLGSLNGTLTSHSLGRFGGDAHLDVLAAAGEVALFVSPGDGTLHTATPIAVTAPEHVLSVVTADLDGDGCDDAIAFDGDRSAPAPQGGLLRTLMGSCDGQLVEHAVVTLERAVDAVATDIDGDGVMDVVAALAAPGGVAIMRGAGLAGPTFIAVDGDPRALATGDLDEDGRIDVVVLSSAGLTVLVNESPVK